MSSKMWNIQENTRIGEFQDVQENFNEQENFIELNLTL